MRFEGAESEEKRVPFRAGLAMVLFGNGLLRVANASGGALIGFYLAHLAKSGAHADATLVGNLGAVTGGADTDFTDFTDYLRGGRRWALVRERLELICLCGEVAFLRVSEQINREVGRRQSVLGSGNSQENRCAENGPNCPVWMRFLLKLAVFMFGLFRLRFPPDTDAYSVQLHGERNDTRPRYRPRHAFPLASDTGISN